MTRRRDVALAGHLGDLDTVREALRSTEAAVRATAFGALARLGALTSDDLIVGAGDLDAGVRRRTAQLAAAFPDMDLRPLLADDDPLVAEMAAWACGEHEEVDDETLAMLIALGVDHDNALVREAAIAALGAIGDERGLPTILHGCRDKPAIRRRAVIALAPFDGDDVDVAIATALTDKDWQVRDAAEELQRAAGSPSD